MNDRRTIRTKTALRKALIELMTEQGYEQTSVQDIVDRANVGRSTFYSHYADREDLLRENLNDLAAFLRSNSVQQNATTQNPPVPPALAFARPMLEHVSEVKEMFVALLGEKSAPAVHELLRDMLGEVVLEALRRKPMSRRVPAEMLADFVAVSFLSVARYWVLFVPKQKLDDVHCQFLELVAPAVS